MEAGADHTARKELADAQQAFRDHAEEWDDYTRAPLGRLRERLVLFHLERELLRRAPGRNVLDAGGGTGGYALALARRGYRVCLLDFSPAMLQLARQRVLSEDPVATERIGFCCLAVEDILKHFGHGHFDVVLCHTLLEYVQQPMRALCDLAGVLKVGGVMSLLLANAQSEVLTSAVVKKDPQRALQALTGSVDHTDLFGLPRHAIALGTVYRQFELIEMQPVAEYGVRIFADYLPSNLLSDRRFAEQLWQLELAASELLPYADIARYKHILAVRAGTASGPGFDLG